MSDWYYAADNEQKGPINESELKENLAANKLPADTLVWKDGMDNWTPANQVPAFSFRPPPTPAKVQPPATAAAATPAPTQATKVVAANPAVNNPDSTKPVDLSTLMGTPEALEVDAADAEKNKIFGILAYLIFFLPLIVAKDSPFAKYHANQGLALFLAVFISWAALAVLWFIPIIGFIFGFMHILVYLGYVVLVVLGIINAAAGKCVPLPIIGGIKLIK